ncbi:hypothetical protein [Blastomonas fulva]|uniref:hypothetical protein n=1 Tax=Blastomonas fulva TaxID=1550728 RepID=UPI003F72E591
MGVFIAYTIALLCTTIFVVQKGDRIAKLSIAGIWVGFCSAEWASLSIRSDEDFMVVIASVETLSLLYKIGMVHLSDRRWPIIVAGLHFNVVCSHISFIISPSYLTKTLYAASTVWAVPVLLVITLGVYADNRWDTLSQGGK